MGEICTSKAVWLKDRRARPETKPDDSQKAMSKIFLDVSENSGVIPPQIIHGLIGFFSLFSPSILGCFPLFLETPIFVYGPLSCASRGVVILRTFFCPRIPVTQISFTCFVLAIPIMLEGSSQKEKRSKPSKSEGTRKHFASRANTIKVHVQDAVLSKITSWTAFMRIILKRFLLIRSFVLT